MELKHKERGSWIMQHLESAKDDRRVKQSLCVRRKIGLSFHSVERESSLLKQKCTVHAFINI